MGGKKYKIIQQAKADLKAYFRRDIPENFGNFFDNLFEGKDHYSNYVDEVGENCVNLSDKKRTEYLASELRSFERYDFPYNTTYLGKVFRRYDQDPNNFPEITSKGLIKVLSMNARSNWGANKSEEEITKVLNNVQIQKACVSLFLHLKLKKVREFLKALANSRENDFSELVQDVELKNTMEPRREAQRDLLKLLDERLIYLGVNNSGLKTENELETERKQLLCRLDDLRDKALEEIEHNVFLYDLEKAVEYLTLYTRELERRRTQLEKYEFDLLNFQDPDFSTSGFTLQLQDRKDIGEALKEVNAHRLNCIGRMQERLQERLQDYDQMKKGQRSALRGEESTSKLIALLEEMNFFSLPDCEGQPDTDIADLLQIFTGHSAQNLRKELGNLKKKPSELSQYQQGLSEWARKRIDAVFAKKRKKKE